MKGISPIVAAVLLIAITMTIAGVLAYWSSTFVESLPVENATTSECRLAQFEFLNCKHNATAGTLIFSLNNVRNINLPNLTAYVEYTNGSIIPSNGYALNESLTGGSIRSYSVSGISSGFSKLLIKTSCPELSRSDICTG